MLRTTISSRKRPTKYPIKQADNDDVFYKTRGIKCQRPKNTRQKLNNKTEEKKCSWNDHRIKRVSFVGKRYNLECSFDH